MTAEEIRKLPLVTEESRQAMMLREIAAQLADLNATLKNIAYDINKLKDRYA